MSRLGYSQPTGLTYDAAKVIEEIADVIAFLTSDEARYVCGSLVEINGGKAVY